MLPRLRVLAACLLFHFRSLFVRASGARSLTPVMDFTGPGTDGTVVSWSEKNVGTMDGENTHQSALAGIQRLRDAFAVPDQAHIQPKIMDLINDIDSVPYYQNDPKVYRQFRDFFWYFFVEGYPNPVGYVKSDFVHMVNWPSFWDRDHSTKTLTLCGGHTFEELSDRMDSTLRAILSQGISHGLPKWGNEPFPIYHQGRNTSKLEHILDIDRCGLERFGVRSFGVHLTAWTKMKDNSTGADVVKYLVPERSKHKPLYPGKLDNAVAGGFASRDGKSPFEAMVREITEETGISEHFSRSQLRQCDVLQFAMNRTNLGQPGWQHNNLFVFEMELNEDNMPHIADAEVEAFNWMTLDEVKDALLSNRFAPPGTITWIAFLIRRGLLNSDNSPELGEICSRLHRKHELFVME